jgi:hypothetical protein
MIPDPTNFHQQFDLFMKVRPKIPISEHLEESERYLDKKYTYRMPPGMPGFERAKFWRDYSIGFDGSQKDGICVPLQRFSVLNQYKFGKIYNFPSRRDPVKGCNDICRHCGKWCNDPNAETWNPYVCLIGRYRVKIPERAHHLQVDPLDNAEPTYPYPFVCMACYKNSYEEILTTFDGYSRFMHKQYEIDHIFLMNVDKYPHMQLPVVKKRRKTWNTTTTIQKLEPTILPLLRDDGFFHIIISQEDHNPFYCWICGILKSANVRGRFVAGIAAHKLPVKSANNRIIPYPSKNGEYILVCEKCDNDNETRPRVFYPFGIKFTVHYNSHIND